MEVANLSPNQRAKRRDIIDAAKQTLEETGLDGFTTRALSERSSFGRSAIHYSFDSVEQIVEAAMMSHLEDFIDHLTALADEHDAPRARFWAVTDGYLEYFSERPRLTLLWFAYSIAGVQAGHPEAALEIEETLRAKLRELLQACDVADVEDRSEALLAFMLGATLRGVLHPSPVADSRRQLAVLSGIAED